MGDDGMPKRKCSSVDASLGQNLTYFRKLTGLTQQQVAERLNLNRTTYTKYETGASEPSIEVLKQLAEIFEVDLATLLEDYDENNPVRDTEEYGSLDAEMRNVVNGYSALSRDDREEVYRLIRQLKG